MATTGSKKPEMVRIKLFKDNKNYTGDVFVGVNGRTWQIQRGVEVEVPAYVAEVLRNSEKQDLHAIMMMEELQKDADWDK